jgi:hypothetical protein
MSQPKSTQMLNRILIVARSLKMHTWGLDRATMISLLQKNMMDGALMLSLETKAMNMMTDTMNMMADTMNMMTDTMTTDS